jgi:large subunit ribosomal protein L21
MKAIVVVKGKQFVVQTGDVLVVDRMQSELGESVSFDSVVMLEEEGKVSLGAPYLEGARVQATVRRHLRGPKIVIFKKNIRKRYQKKQGHRQDLSELVVNAITA